MSSRTIGTHTNIFIQPVDSITVRTTSTHHTITPLSEIQLTHCTNGEREKMYSLCQSIVFKKQEVLYYQEEQAGKLYLLERGAVKVTNFTINGREFIIEVIGRKGLFGQIPDLDETKIGTSAVGIEPGSLYILDKKGYEQLKEREPQLAVKLRNLFEYRRNRREENLIGMLSCTVEQRLVKALLHLLYDFGVPKNEGFLLKSRLTHKDFADMIASTRETVTSILSKFRKEKLIEYEGRYIVVNSLCRMRTIAGWSTYRPFDPLWKSKDFLRRFPSNIPVRR